MILRGCNHFSIQIANRDSRVNQHARYLDSLHERHINEAANHYQLKIMIFVEAICM